MAWYERKMMQEAKTKAQADLQNNRDLLLGMIITLSTALATIIMLR